MKLKLILICATLALFGGLVQAAPICTTGTMASYISQGSCSIGNITFSFGSNAYIFAPDDISVSAAQVTVTPVGTGLAANSQTGFTFAASNNGWTATNPDVAGTMSADVNITFEASLALPGVMLNSTNVTVNPTLVNFAGSTGLLVGEGITDVATSNNLGSINLSVVGNNDVQSIANGGTALSGTAFFASNDVSVNKDINILALDGPVPAASASMTGLTETFTYGAVPEPGPFMLVGIGLAMFLFRRSLKTVLGLMAVLALVTVGSSSVAQAAPLCVSGHTLAQYITAGACHVGDVTFTFNASSLTSSGTGTAPTTSGTIVSVINSGGDVGFQFTPNSPAPKTVGAQTENFIVTFTAQAAFDGVTAFASSDTITTAGTGTFGTTSTGVLKKTAGATLGTVTYPAKTSGGASASFATVAAGTSLTITDTFHMVSSGSGLANSTHLSNLTDTIHELPAAVPEPVSAVLFGFGLVGLGMVGKSRKA